jgi:hypothetical protein
MKTGVPVFWVYKNTFPSITSSRAKLRCVDDAVSQNLCYFHVAKRKGWVVFYLRGFNAFHRVLGEPAIVLAVAQESSQPF